jgi:hypothetical protein
MRLAIVRGVATASIGLVAVCVPTSWGERDSFNRADLTRSPACRSVPFGADPAILASAAELGASRFEFRLPVDVDATAERGPPATSSEPTVETSASTSASQPARVMSAATLATLRVSAPRVTELSVTGIRALQSQLKRLGCYQGRIDGDWGPASRYAAAKFTSAVNAALPVDQPEPALLALARRHQGTCTKTLDSSRIVTASTTPITRAVVSSGGVAFENSAATARTGRRKATYAWDAPRVVHANGMLATISDLAPASLGKNRVERPMALGAEPENLHLAQPARPKARQGTRKEKKYRRRVVDPPSAFRRRSRGRYQTARRGRKSWERRVLQSVNLSAQ